MNPAPTTPRPPAECTAAGRPIGEVPAPAVLPPAECAVRPMGEVPA